MNIEGFTRSVGWLNNFKKRHNIKQLSEEKLTKEKEKLQELINNFDLENVFNCDETGLYWELEPSETLSIGLLSEIKKSKNRVTLLLIFNATVHSVSNPELLTNITIHYLPSNTTAHLQPADTDIINSFKAQYRKRLIKNRIEAYDNKVELNIPVSKLKIDDYISLYTEA
ncbi:jerky protein homolog-like [Rhizophagus clarus]|uniref:Jerky protein homolog-like n=1 Tax=Rhizophagus clarus TaxID=94130 RepID=A0A8H3M319_9GLOM|nr:jerky protein homolog-like [Rhizophagus clarus]